MYNVQISNLLQTESHHQIPTSHFIYWQSVLRPVIRISKFHFQLRKSHNFNAWEENASSLKYERCRVGSALAYPKLIKPFTVRIYYIDSSGSIEAWRKESKRSSDWEYMQNKLSSRHSDAIRPIFQEFGSIDVFSIYCILEPQSEIPLDPRSISSKLNNWRDSFANWT